jgi:lipoprotein-anchoring transpeptidase ErfK/SrfK
MAKKIVVKLDRQVLLAYDGDQLVHEFDCATGDDEHGTTAGLYAISRKHRYYRSRKYDAQMNFAMFFSRDGKAIHESHGVGVTSYLRYLGVTSLGSHGCVRLASDNAATMFEWTPVGTKVYVQAS